ncbi:hypothetical protein [Fredinandcohnia onubensis]|uniref:hypothetical protein n=1 Tax=Fredinandcohnia onubensis TaxID=1571209 RepID=UPI000C0BFDA6|nr:hypothetical protein [Fredinandcohnia onubensis]
MGHGTCPSVLGILVPEHQFGTVDEMGRADIVEEGGGRVEGKIYEIPIEAVKNFRYQREGAPYAYHAIFLTIKLNCKETKVSTFTVKNKTEETAP